MRYDSPSMQIKDKRTRAPAHPPGSDARHPLRFTVSLALFLILTTPLFAADLPATPLRERLKLKNFITRDYTESGKLNWILTAQQALVGIEGESYLI